MSRKTICFIGIISLLFGGLLFLPSGKAQSMTDPPKNGLPISISVVSNLVSGTGSAMVRTITLESKPIAFTRRNSVPEPMNDPLYPGWRGEYPNLVWMQMPHGYAPSINPKSVVDPEYPSWWSQMQEYIASHPSLTLEQPIQCLWGKRDFETGIWHVDTNDVLVFPYAELCNYSTTQPEACVIRVTATIHGDTSDLNLPSTGNHYIYIVKVQ